jgi:hypothetical protein
MAQHLHAVRLPGARRDRQFVDQRGDVRVRCVEAQLQVTDPGVHHRRPVGIRVTSPWIGEHEPDEIRARVLQQAERTHQVGEALGVGQHVAESVDHDSG